MDDMDVSNDLPAPKNQEVSGGAVVCINVQTQPLRAHQVQPALGAARASKAGKERRAQGPE